MPPPTWPPPTAAGTPPAPRWRAEIRRTKDGVNFAEPIILIGEGRNARVVTPLGTTPLDQHAAGRDSLVRAAVVFDESGKRTGVANGAVIDAASARIAYRRTARAPNFNTESLNPRNQALGRQLISRSLVSVGDQRSVTVVATAGARGVGRVKTARGDVVITPDTLAVKRMERFAISAVRLEDFMRTAGLGPYRRGTR